MRATIILPGGGAKGAFQVGALSHILRKTKIDPIQFAGVSTGALQASCSAQGKTREDLLHLQKRLEDVWFGIRKNSDIYKHRFAYWFKPLFGADSIYHNGPLWDIIQKNVDRKALMTSGRRLEVGTVCHETGQYKAFPGGDPNILEAILASTAMPIYFQPIEIDGKHYVDGGVRNVIPPCIPMGQPIVIDTSPGGIGEREDINDMGDIAGRTIEIAVNETHVNDIEYWKKQGAIFIRPKERYDTTLDFDPHEIRKEYQDGRRIALEVLG